MDTLIVDYKKDLEHLLHLAKNAGFVQARFDAKSEGVNIPHDFGNGRVQHVNVSINIDDAYEYTPDKTTMAIFQSKCMDFKCKKNDLLKSGMVLELLEQNSAIHFGRFALKRIDDNCLIYVSCDQLLSNLDSKEFESVVRYVAKIADDCENEYRGLDLY